MRGGSGELWAAARCSEAAGSHLPVAFSAWRGGRLRPSGRGAVLGNGRGEHVAAGPRRGVGGQEGDRSCSLPSSWPVWALNSWRTRPTA